MSASADCGALWFPCVLYVSSSFAYWEFSGAAVSVLLPLKNFNGFSVVVLLAAPVSHLIDNVPMSISPVKTPYMYSRTVLPSFGGGSSLVFIFMISSIASPFQSPSWLVRALPPPVAAHVLQWVFRHRVLAVPVSHLAD
mmetsp:Transcript_18924/g.43448  ORF Transcript_18924/g.43448 Transcript_18924/m.43448 type:complete len:139 (-) Transcript_18924:590-1006(-)